MSGKAFENVKNIIGCLRETDRKVGPPLAVYRPAQQLVLRTTVHLYFRLQFLSCFIILFLFHFKLPPLNLTVCSSMAVIIAK